MGREYNLRCQNFDRETALQFIHRYFVVIKEFNSLIHLKLQPPEINNTYATDESTGPSVLLTLEADGFYFCDNLTSQPESAVIFKQLVDFLALTNDEIQVMEL